MNDPHSVTEFLLPGFDWQTQHTLETLGLLIAAALLKILLQRKGQPERESTNWASRHRVALAFAGLGLVVSAGAWILENPLPVVQISTIFVVYFLTISGLTRLVRDRLYANSLAFLAYLAAAFFLLVWFENSVAALSEFSFKVGTTEITLFGVLQAILLTIAAVWVGVTLAEQAEKRLEKFPSLSPSMRVLIGKTLKILLIVAAILFGVNFVGIDLTLLAAIGGGLGLGIGIGLQKIVSNLVCGFALLSDRSIKPGDTLEIEGTYGWVNNLRARYVSIITRDATEILIPNEDFITQRVVNWSFTHNLVRQKADIGISYKADVHKAMDLCLEAASGIERVLEKPKPVCLLMGFGDSSVNLQLRFWIEDPQNGIANVRSAVLLRVWDLFAEHGIEIPFPQRDLHLKQPAEISVRLQREKEEEDEQ